MAKIYLKENYLDKNCSFGMTYINQSLRREPTFHTHEFIEICYVADGKGFHDVDGYTSEVKRGDLFIIDLEMGHCFFSDRLEDNLTTYNIMFRTDIIDDAIVKCEDFRHINEFRMFKNFFPYLSPKYDIRFDSEERESIEELIRRMYKEYAEKNLGYVTAIKGYLTVFITKIMRGLAKYSNEDITNHYRTHHEIILAIINNIKQNYHSKLNLNELARTSLISKGHLCNTFKRETGMTLSEYINHIRISEACKAIESDPYINLAELAYKIGFGNYKIFYKTFKEIVGTTPKEKRDMFREIRRRDGNADVKNDGNGSV